MCTTNTILDVIEYVITCIPNSNKVFVVLHDTLFSFLFLNKTLY